MPKKCSTSIFGYHGRWHARPNHHIPVRLKNSVNPSGAPRKIRSKGAADFGGLHSSVDCTETFQMPLGYVIGILIVKTLFKSLQLWSVVQQNNVKDVGGLSHQTFGEADASPRPVHRSSVGRRSGCCFVGQGVDKGRLSGIAILQPCRRTRNVPRCKNRNEHLTRRENSRLAVEVHTTTTRFERVMAYTPWRALYSKTWVGIWKDQR